MDKVRVYFDKKGNSLSVWFDDPKKEIKYLRGNR